MRTRLVIVRHVVWHKVLPGKYLRLVISRDPEGIEKGDYFFTKDLQLDAGILISAYADRWCIEDTFRNGKQFLGVDFRTFRLSSCPRKDSSTKSFSKKCESPH